ncbi:MAG: T9SS type A sorting domain-containing protein [Flavobacteriaceae bacterium]|nr:T9SS type A sorting domain-containing protein [Flavobacteriaceae bacterium]
MKTLVFSILLLPSLLIADTFFITQNGTGLMDGSSWENAASGNDLQNMINSALSGDEIWVACGTYVPTLGTDRSISFSMRNGIIIYGGFQGTELNINERNFSCGPCSELSGEIGIPGISDNSYTVIYNEQLTNTAILDGFVIRDGNDDRNPTSDGNGLGGGVYNHGYGSTGFCHPEIRNCIFFNNRASWGGGAFNNGYNNGHTQPTYINCIFYQNHAYREAGAMDSYGVGGTASPTIYNSIFYENTSATNVGAMYVWGGNTGGNAHPTLINCIFSNNAALNGYGGAFIADSQDETGGASSGSCTITLQNCIIRNNSSTTIAPQFYVRGTNSQVLATYSNIELSAQNSPHTISGSGTGNIDTNPLFLNISNALGVDGCWMTNDDGLQLTLGSTSIDSGTNIGTHTSDILGLERIVDGTVDMGPYEYQSTLSTSSFTTKKPSIYPNPVRDILHIESSTNTAHNISITSILGVILEEFTFASCSLGCDIDIHHLNSGLYVIQVNDFTYKIYKY